MSAAVLRKSSTPIPNGRGYLFGALAKALRPRRHVSVSEWADSHRVLTRKASAEPGKWRTERTPYLREPMDALGVTSPVERVVLMFSAQIGKTEAALNWMGYVVDHAPAPMLVVLPTLEVRDRWVKQRLDPMLAETPRLSALVRVGRSRDASNARDLKDFPGGMFVLGGANSPASLASMPIRFVICDEVDRFPWEIGQEGDPLGLIDERTKTFARRKVLLVSTPTVAGESRIEAEYERTDCREYQVPCPHCDAYQVLRWRHEDGRYGLTRNSATGAVYYTCAECGGVIEEHHKTRMLDLGKWVPRHPERTLAVTGGARGYHINALYSPVGLGFGWAELWRKWEMVQGDSAELRRFINTTLAQSWEERGDGIEHLSLLTRLEDYPRVLPIKLRTAGVDVQKDRLEVSIDGWGDGEECWAIDHVIIDIESTSQDAWDALDDVLQDYRVQFAAVDSGYNASLVYAFCEGKRWCFPTKGVTGFNRPLVEDDVRRRQRLRRRKRKGVAVEPVGVDQGKTLLYSRLKTQHHGANYMHFPRAPAFDDEYFEQLTAEELVTRYKGNRPIVRWVAKRKRNEALDCKLLSMVAMRLGGGVPERAAVDGLGVMVELDAQPSDDQGPPNAEIKPKTPAAASEQEWSFERRS